MIAYVFFQRGFFIIGSLFNNPLLKIISIVLSALLTLVLGFDIISVYSSAELEMVRAGASLSFGVVGVLFGISLIKLNHSFGVISLLAGGLEIIAGCFFVTIALFFVGFFVQIPAELLEIIIIYKAAEIIKNKTLVSKVA